MLQLKIKELYSHPLLQKVLSEDDLKVFMETHVFAVWDFMSLVKSLQHLICPSTNLWMPVPSTRNNSAGLINEIILYEESDIAFDNKAGRISHFDLYLQGMLEIGADTTNIDDFIRHIRTDGIGFAMAVLEKRNKVAHSFVTSTFETIHTGEAHLIASSFLHGRESVIPDMFTSILKSLSVEAPRFEYYLERHIELDGDEHGPAAERLLASLTEGIPHKIIEAENMAVKSINARIKFLHGIKDTIEKDDDIGIPNPFSPK